MKSMLTSTRLRMPFGLTLMLSVGLLVAALEASHRNKFELVGTATFAKDPTSQSNFVIKVDNTNGFGGVRRDLNTKITALDEHLTVRYYFVGPKTCGGGSPRIQLAVDLDGDGMTNGNAFGHIGPSPSFTMCQTDEWVTEDLTISALENPMQAVRWDIGQLGGSAFTTWDNVKLHISAFVNHKVLRATLIEDQAFGMPPGFFIPRGVTYYDDITLGERTLEDQRDVSGSN
jgi:hypothetical protein